MPLCSFFNSPHFLFFLLLILPLLLVLYSIPSLFLFSPPPSNHHYAPLTPASLCLSMSQEEGANTDNWGSAGEGGRHQKFQTRPLALSVWTDTISHLIFHRQSLSFWQLISRAPPTFELFTGRWLWEYWAADVPLLQVNGVKQAE